MKLAKLAQRNVHSVAPDDSIDVPICLMEEHRIHHLPVVSDEAVVGMLSDRDLLIAVGWRLEIERAPVASGSGIVGPARVSEIMSKPAVCLSPETDVHTAARLMAEAKIHAFPLVNHGRLVGLVTSTDLLRWYRDHPNCGRDRAWLEEPVGRRMRTVVHTIGAKEPLHAAAAIMRRKYFRHLAVVSRERLVGVISDRDIRRACGQEVIEDEKAQATGEFHTRALVVGDHMSRQLQTVDEGATMLDALRKLTDHRIGCLPVTRNDGLVGMLTETDLLRLVGRIDAAGGEV